MPLRGERSLPLADAEQQYGVLILFTGALLWRVVSDLVSPFLHRDGIEMEYRMRRVGATLTIEGVSQSKDRRGEPLLRTHLLHS